MAAMKRPSIVLAILLSALSIAAAASAPDWESAGKRWWSYVQFLADDKLEGRLTGSEGYRKAADYVRTQFEAAGLQPKGTEGYFQPVRFDVQRVIAAKSKMALVRDTEHSIRLGEDAILGSRLPQPETIDAPLAFIGYGLHIPDANYDDFADQNLHGKIVVYLNGGPSNLASALKAHSHSAQVFLAEVQRAGAVGTISIPNPKSMDIPWPRIALSASQPGMRIADQDLQDTKGPLFTATLNPAHAQEFFEGSGHTLSELLALADAGKPLPRFALKGSVRATVSAEKEQVESPNIIGVLPGSDPVLKNEYVVLTAHLDHLGVGEPINGDKIYNGAMDDASGIATILEVARTLHESGAHLRRSILFVAVCAEEKGLLGSRYFAGHPTVPRHAMVADLNTDMFLPLYPLHYVTVYGLEESTLGDDIRSVAEKMDVKVLADRQPDRNIFIRSDQYNFILKGVPSIAMKFSGATPDSPEEKTAAEWLKNRYHAPSDDVNQPVDLVAAARFNQMLMNLTERVADADHRPQWKESSFFKRFAQLE